MVIRLVGTMPAVVVMGIFDSLKNAIVEGISEIAQNIADAMTAWATWAIKANLTTLSGGILPDTKTLLQGPLSVLLGSTYGLAVLILYVLVVVAGFVSIIATFRRRRLEFATKTASSAIGLLLFTIVFPVFYGFGALAVTDMSQAGLTLAAKSPDDTTSSLTASAVAALTPGNMALQFLAGFINGAFGSTIFIELVCMAVGMVIITFFYPLSLVFRPFGSRGLNVFRFATAGMVGIPLSLIVVAFLLSVQLVATTSANKLYPFLGGFASLFFGIVFGLVTALTPVVVLWLAYNKVSETFSNSDVRYQSGIDVNSMPDVNTHQIGSEDASNKTSYIRQFATELPGAIAAGENDPGTEAKELGKQIGLQAAVSSGNPYVAAAGVALTVAGMVNNMNKPSPKDGGDSSE